MKYRIPLNPSGSVVFAFERLPTADYEINIVIACLNIALSRFREALAKKDYNYPDTRRKGTRKGVLYRTFHNAKI